MFPATITTLCELTGVDINRKNYAFLNPTSNLGARAYDKITLARGEPHIGYDPSENDVNPILNEVGIRGRTSDARAEVGGINRDTMSGLTEFMAQIRDGQRQIINMLEKLGERVDRIEQGKAGGEGMMGMVVNRMW